jgi:hypothetical protein
MRRLLVISFLCLFCHPVWAAQCSDKSFLEFFARYAVDQDFSQNRTVWPLQVSTELFGDKKTQQITFIKTRAENWALEKPIFDFLRANPRVGISVSTETKSKVILTFGIEDADILFDLGFAKSNGCWQLIGIREFER